MKDIIRIEKVLSKYKKQSILKIYDFLISEIDIDNVEETIDFITISDIEKKEKYKEILYVGDKFKGLFIEGNQYLIGNYENDVLIIDMVGEEHGLDKETFITSINLLDFIFLIKNKRAVINWIKNQF